MKYGVYLKHGDIWEPASRLYENRQDAEHFLKIVSKINPFGEYKIIEI